MHGFRYTARALVSILAETREAIAWPRRQFELDGQAEGGGGASSSSSFPGSGVGDLVQHLMRRVDSASGPYQMVHFLGDGIVLSCDPTNRQRSVVADYLEDIPLEYFNRKYAGVARFWWGFGYANQRQPYGKSLNDGTKFNVFLWHYPGTCDDTSISGSGNSHRGGEYDGGSYSASASASPSTTFDEEGFAEVQPKELLELFETFHTIWNLPSFREQVHSFVESRINKMRRGATSVSVNLEETANSEEVGADQRGNAAVEAPRQATPLVEEGSEKGRNARWHGAAVDLLVTNVGPTPILLRRIRPGTAVKDLGAPKPPYGRSGGMDEIAAAEVENIGLPPLRGQRIFTEEGERWIAIGNSANTVGHITVDIAHGIVQDWIVTEEGWEERGRREEQLQTKRRKAKKKKKEKRKGRKKKKKRNK